MKNKISGYPAVVASWTEIEKGWGMRPDGISIHLDDESYLQYCQWIEEINKDFPNEYSVPEDKNSVLISEELFNQISETENRTLRVDRSDEREIREKHFLFG